MKILTVIGDQKMDLDECVSVHVLSALRPLRSVFCTQDIGRHASCYLYGYVCARHDVPGDGKPWGSNHRHKDVIYLAIETDPTEGIFPSAAES